MEESFLFLEGDERMKGQNNATARRRPRRAKRREEEEAKLNKENRERSSRGAAGNSFPLEFSRIWQSQLYSNIHTHTTYILMSVRYNPRHGDPQVYKTISTQRMDRCPSSVAVAVVKIKAR